MGTDLTPQEIETCNSWLVEDVAAGKLTEAQANSIGREANSDFPDEAPAAPQPVFEGDIPPAAHIGQYRFPLYQAPGQGEATARVADRDLRASILAAGFDPARGSQFGKAIIESAGNTHGNTDLQNDIHGNKQGAQLIRMWGEQEFEQRMPTIKAFIDRVEARKPGFRALLERTGALDSAAVVTLLYTQSEIERERREWKPTN